MKILLEQALSTRSSLNSSESTFLPQAKVPTAPSCHPVHLQPMTELLPQLPKRPEPGETVCEIERELHKQGEKAARANLSFTTDRVKGRTCHGRPCRLPSPMPTIIFNSNRRASYNPRPRKEKEWENITLPAEAIEKNEMRS